MDRQTDSNAFEQLYILLDCWKVLTIMIPLPAAWIDVMEMSRYVGPADYCSCSFCSWQGRDRKIFGKSLSLSRLADYFEIKTIPGVEVMSANDRCSLILEWSHTVIDSGFPVIPHLHLSFTDLWIIEWFTFDLFPRLLLFLQPQRGQSVFTACYMQLLGCGRRLWQLCVFICSDASRYLTEVLSPVDGRHRHLWLDKIIELVQKQPCES